MHLVIVSPFPPAITGIGQYGYHVTRALAKSAAFERITVLAGSSVHGVSPNHLGVTEMEYCWEPDRSKARTAILSRVRRLDPDLVWFNVGASVFGRSPWLNISGLSTTGFVQRMGYPTVVTLHELIELTDLHALKAPGGPLARAGGRMLTRIATQADVVCLTMRQYADELTARGADCVHIPIGAYHEPQMLGEPDGQELLFFTTLAPFKGLEFLLEAFQLLKKEHPDLKLNIAGVEHMRFPKYGTDLQRRFEGLDGVQWLGEIAEEDVIGLFQRSQLVVLPYIASTGSSSVLYQAAMWGRPVVASNLGEIERLVEESGLQVEFFQNEDAASLRDAIHTLLVSSEARRRQSTHNFGIIQLTHPSETCRQYIAAFNRALAKKHHPRRIVIPNPEREPA